MDLKERLCVVLALGSLPPSFSCLTFSPVCIPSLSWKRKTWCPDPFGLLLPPKQYSPLWTALLSIIQVLTQLFLKYLNCFSALRGSHGILNILL